MLSWFGKKQLRGVSERIVELIHSDAIWPALGLDAKTQKIDFQADNVKVNSYADRLVYEGIPMESIPKGFHIIVLFPHNRTAIDSASYSTLEGLNTEINKRMSCDTNEIQLTVCWKDYMYNVTGVTGNIYIEWLSKLSIHEKGKREITKTSGDIGFIVNTDGHYKSLAIYPLLDIATMKQAPLFINPGSYIFPQPIGMSLHADDVPRPPTKVHHIKTLSQEEVNIRRDLLTLPTHEKVDFDHYSELRRRADPNRDSDHSFNNYYGDEVTSGVSIDMEPIVIKEGDDDAQHMIDTDDDIAMAFFSSAVPGEQEAVLNAQRANMLHLQVAADAAADQSLFDDAGNESEDYYSAPPSDRRHVPMGLIPQNEHRTSVRGIKLATPIKLPASHSISAPSAVGNNNNNNDNK